MSLILVGSDNNPLYVGLESAKCSRQLLETLVICKGEIEPLLISMK